MTGFGRALHLAEERLRAEGLHGRAAFTALARHLARRANLDPALWPEGSDARPGVLDLLPLGGDEDLFGLAYEAFFADLFKGTRGQYFTPRGLVELAVSFAAIQPGEVVLDPTCGSGGFLVVAHRQGAVVRGVEIDPDLAVLARLNLARVGAAPGITVGDFFTIDVPPVDVILANPPFSVRSGDTTTDLLFLERALGCLRPGGRLVAVMPYTLLDGALFEGVRARVDELAVKEAVVSLPEGLFLPFGGTMTRSCLVALRKRPAPERAPWMAVVRQPGFDPKRKRYKPTEPDELALLRERRIGRPGRGWVPERALHDDEVRSAKVRLGDLAPRAKGATATGAEVVAFADVDKRTGEVVSRSEGVAIQAIAAGDLLVGKMRPELNNVALAREAAGGTGEWLRLRPKAHPHFVLIAARSSFARAQLRATRGQTRPRVTPEAILALELPDPGPVARARIDRIVAEAHAVRSAARARLDTVADLYERYGRGELDGDALLAGLDAIPTR